MITSKDCYMKNECSKYNHSNCNCDTEDFYCPKLFRIDTLYDAALLTDKQRRFVNLTCAQNDVDFNVYVELSNISKCIEQVVSNGYSFYLYSSTGCGNGKTAWSIRLIQSYINKIWYKSDLECQALFIHVPKLLIELKNFSKPSPYVEHIEQYIETADIVVWDEFGNKAGTQFEIERLLNYINGRVENNKTNIYTSNLSPAQIQDGFGERLYSRIINLSKVFEFKGPDRRSPFRG